MPRVTTAPALTTVAPPSRPAAPARRGDIQGMRALAILAVVLYHAGVPGLTGGFVGVDLFFVVSGFLITGLLLREVAGRGQVDLSRFWARRVRRLLPASTLALLATGVGIVTLLPLLERSAALADLRWATLFSANWRFALQETDYLAGGRATSPVLHFWSLGVEEQFYVVWPLLIALVVVAVRALRRRTGGTWSGVPTRTLTVVIAVVAVASFVECVRLTTTNQPFAFFGTPARAWQLAAGALLALGAPQVGRLPAAVRQALGVAGLVGLGVAVAALSEGGRGGFAYPGSASLLPTLSAVALLAAGTGGDTLVGRALSVQPLQWIGDVSYSWYLWHWPFLVIGGAALGGAGPRGRIALALASLVVAAVAYRFVENPLRSAPRLARSNRLSMAFGAVMVLITLGATQLLAARTQDTVAEGIPITVPGPDGELVERVLRPDPAVAAQDYRAMTPLGCALSYEDTVPNECLFGDPEGDRSAVLLGDSHSSVMLPGLDLAGQAQGWRVNLWGKNACPIADVTKWDDQRKAVFTECDEYRTAVLERTIAAQPDVVFLVSAYNSTTTLIDRTGGAEITGAAMHSEMASGLRSVAQRLTAAGIHVVLIDEPPQAPFDPPDCLVEQGSAEACAFPAPEGWRTSPESDAADGLADVEVLDLSTATCPGETCHVVAEDMVVYRDQSHLTKTYVESLTPSFEALLARLG